MRISVGGKYAGLVHGLGCACHTPAFAEINDRISRGLSRRSVLQGIAAAFASVAAAPIGRALADTPAQTLLTNLRKVSGVLADRDDDIVALMKDSDVLLRALVARRESVHRLLVSTSQLSTELTALVQQSRADLKPALSNLRSVVGVLRKNQANIDNSMRLLAPFYRVFASTLGNGPWFDTYIFNLPPAPGTVEVLTP